MTPKNYLLVKLLWAKDANRKDLYRARRCLLTHAPVEFAETGFQLLPVISLEDLVSCLSEWVEADQLVVFPAPVLDEMTEGRYEMTVQYVLEELCVQLQEVIDSPRKVTAATFNKCKDVLDNAIILMDDAPEIVKIQSYLDKIIQFDHNANPIKGKQYLKGLVGKVQGMAQA